MTLALVRKVDEPRVFVNDPRDPCWGMPAFPEWVTSFREEQWQAFVEITNHYANGADVVMVDAPVGTGKTLLAEMVKRWLAVRALYVCSGKALQDQFCVAPDTRILTGELEWINADAVVVGQELLAFDEDRSPNRRMWRRSVVEEIDSITRPSKRITFDDGTVVTCSDEHQWLVGHGQVVRWARTDELRSGGKNATKVVRLLDVWDTATDMDAGYLAAAFDGEGHLHQSYSTAAGGVDVNLSFAQKDNPMFDEVRAALDRYTIPWTSTCDPTGCNRLLISGRANALRFLGEIRPKRLLPKLNLDMLGMMNPTRPAAVVAIEDVGVQRVIAIRTSTGTYVAEGLASHNCRDFPYAKVLKGRSNYATADHPDQFTPGDRYNNVSASDCDLHRAFLPACDACPGDSTDAFFNDNADDEVPHCSECHPVTRCPYTQAKAIALASPLSCINTSYLLAEANTAGRFSKQQFIIVDECDLLEKELMSYYEVTISDRRRRALGIDFPKRTQTAGTRDRYDDHGATYTDWGVWFEKATVLVAKELRRHPRHSADRRIRKEVDYLDKLYARLLQVSETIGDGNWVYTGYDRGEITFKPVTVGTFGHNVLWRHGQKWLLMSGTIIDPTEMVTSLGIPEEMRWEVVTVPMSFPRENRPVKIIPVCEMSNKNKDEAWPKMAAMIEKIADKHPTERILVHAVSYALSAYLVDALHDTGRVVTYTEASDREPALQRYLDREGAILVAPSMDRGVDLPGDACRVQVIVKLPFPYLGDKQISTRLYSTRGGQQWYIIQCIRSFVQMTGRGVRNENDYAMCVSPETLVLTDDLRWVEAGSLSVGDGLRAFDEEPGTRLNKRKWSTGEVVATGIKDVQRLAVRLSNGQTLVCTPNHRWVMKDRNGDKSTWRRTDELTPGDRLMRYANPWTTLDTRDAGWLAGMYDGEGHLGIPDGHTVIDLAQKIGPVHAEANRLLEEYGFTVSRNVGPNDIGHLRVNGGLAEQMRLLGSLRPIRLLDKFMATDPSRFTFLASELVEVVAVENIGVGPIVTLATSTETYLADGFGAHNTYVLDKAFQNNIWKKAKNLIPRYLRDAIDWSGRL